MLPGLPTSPPPISSLRSSAQDLLFCWPLLNPTVSMGSQGAQAWVTGLKQALTHVRYPCRDPDEVYDDVEPTDHSGPGPRSRGDRAGHSARPVC